MTEERIDVVGKTVDGQEDEKQEIVEETVERQEDEKHDDVGKTVEEQEDEERETFGEVANCKKLNVRTAPTKKAAIKKIINENDVVELIESQSTDEWFKVRTEDGVEGFCMKQYITIQP